VAERNYKRQYRHIFTCRRQSRQYRQELTAQDGNTIKANDAESLTEATLGWRLPLNGLNNWVLGRPSNSKIEASSWDDAGRLLTLKQDGWDISYENYVESNGVFLPSKTVLKSEKVNLKLLVEKWVGVTKQ
jgi:outer membrane lipoprotein LolB